MKSMMWSVALLVAAVVPVAVGAQSGTMAKNDKMDKMEMKDATYIGCIAAGTAAGTFVLTHVVDDHKGQGAMKKDAMKKDTMAKDTMTATTMPLMSASVDLSKHLGHKVSVTGTAAHEKMDAMGKDTMAKDGMAKDGPAFTVKSLKMVATSCS